ncbi:hypothetical protein H1R20_g8470, partial [Candolleomyces eurysporus]
MNSYPPELLAQLAPVMFVAGLEGPPKPPQEQDPAAPAPDAFQVLAIRLREALLNQRKVAIWQPDKSKTFQVVLVDKEVRFPPRKLVPPEDPQYSISHSPLSPLTPSSPLFPDGIIAPIWIRKHTTLVPSVFVMFMRIFEFPPHVLRSPLEGHDSEKERLEEERRMDTELATEIAQRKKGTNERGVKLTVVLMASRRLLEYYTAHSKRVRRKRNRHSQAVASYPNPAAALVNPNIARPLRPEGWTVRYEYKMACFAEFRGEDEVALKHYQDAYATLTIMFGSTAILPPRTKRWAEAKVLADCIDIKQNNNPIALSPGFSNEKKVDHLSLVLELYTKAYELFKRHSPTPSNQATSRLTSWIAYRIAETHYEAGKFDTASRFFERIAKTYRKEGWYPMLNPLLSRWYSCAQQMGDVELSIKLLIEMMGQDLAESEDPNALEEDLLAVFQSTVPSSTDEPLTFDISNAKPLGSLVSATPVTLSIQKLVCNMEQNTWRVKVPLDPHLPRLGSTSEPRWLRCLDPPQFIAVKRPDSGTTVVKPRPHLFTVSVVHQEPAFLDENYPIVIEVVNLDNRNLEIIADVLLQPTDIDYAVNSISANGETSTGLIKDISFGVLAPGVRATKTLTLLSGGAAGNRLLDISISAHSPQTDDAPEAETEQQTDELDDLTSPTQLDKTIHQQTINVPTVAPFVVGNDVTYVRDREEWPGPASLDTFEDESFDPRKGTEALVNVTFSCPGPWSVYIENIALETVNAPEVKVTDCSIGLADGSLFPAEYLSGDEIQVFCNAKVGIRDDGKSEQYLFPSPGRYVVTWRRVLKDGSHGNVSTTVVALPALSPPTDELVALFDLPAAAKLHTPLPLTVTIRNYHPTRSANVTVQLEPDLSDGFVVAGLRSGRVPVLLPGAEEKLTWSLIPLECGYQPIPRIKVFDRRKAIPATSSTDGALQAEGFVGDPVKVVDLRRDQRRVVQVEAESEGGDTTDIVDYGTNFGSVLVLPN